MSIRIRVYPQTGAYGGLGYGGMGAVSAATFYNQKLQTQQQVSNLRLGYERALWNERLERVRLEERMKNPYAMYGAVGYGAYPVATVNPYGTMLGASMLGARSFFGSLGLGGLF